LFDQYVNDRPYAATSFLSVALNGVFRTAMSGASKERPELARLRIPLEVRILPLPSRGGDDLLHALFAPLGWQVESDRIQAPDGPSRYVSLTLKGSHTVADALSHLYVLVPVLDDDKHYWVGEDEVDKLLSKGGTWLATHPKKETIVHRYLKHRRGLARAALARLVPEETAEPDEEGVPAAAAEAALETPIRLNDQRMDAVLAALKATGATSVADLGCGEGRLLGLLVRDRRFARLIGLDACMRTLERASNRLKLNLAGGPSADRVRLLHGALTYRDKRWKEVEAAALVEVIEHVEPDRLPALADTVFGFGRPKSVIVTTPNSEYNTLFPNLEPGKFRHADHRFEWTRAEFQNWAVAVAEQYGYAVAFHGIGATNEVHGTPTQMAVFSLNRAGGIAAT
jgi:3' terminal RNA ribose 2'-O-methyltransferase Hen1